MIADALGTLLRAMTLLTLGVAMVFLLRPAVRRLAGARVAYALWLLPLVVLAADCLPAREMNFSTPAPAIAVAVPAIEMIRSLPATAAASVGAPVSAADSAALLATILAGWTLGALGLAVALGLQQRRFRDLLGDLRREERDGQPIHFADTIDAGPAVVGALLPKVIVPADFEFRYTPDEQALVLAHERCHVRRRDPLVNALVTGVRCLFWFNPLIHLAGSALRHDQELACDAATINGHPGAMRRYAGAMLKSQAVLYGLPLGCYWPSSRRHPLNRRIALLRHRPSGFRRTLGGTMILATVVTIGLTSSALRASTPIEPATPLGSRPAAVSTAWTPDALPMLIHTARGVANEFLGLPSVVESARRGDVGEVRDRLQSGGDVNEIVPGDGTPLIQAARRGRLDLARELLDRGADPNLAVRGDGNPLIMASAGGHLAIVELLLQRGADVNGYVPDDETPLINAAARGHLAVVKLLVERGANVNLAYDVASSSGNERRSPLGQAIRFGHQDVANYLQSLGAVR